MGEGEVEIGRGDGRGGRAGAATAQLGLHLVARPRRKIALGAEADAPQVEDGGIADRLEASLDVAGELRSGGDWCRRLRRRGRGERTRERQEGGDVTRSHAAKVQGALPIGNQMPIGARSSEMPGRSTAPFHAATARTASGAV